MLKGCAKVCDSRACQRALLHRSHNEHEMKICRTSGDFRRVLFSKPHGSENCQPGVQRIKGTESTNREIKDTNLKLRTLILPTYLGTANVAIGNMGCVVGP